LSRQADKMDSDGIESGRIENGWAAGFVLAGGQSSRMGRDKALVELGGQPLVARPLNILRQAGLSATIAGARSALSRFAPVIDDAGALSGSPSGPLSGICAALESMQAEFAVFLSVDMPLLPSSLVAYLLDRARITGAVAVVASVNGFAQTFPAVVRKAALSALRVELSCGKGGCLHAFREAAAQLNLPFTTLTVENLVQAGQVEHPSGLPPAFWFLNVNTPADLERAESWLSLTHRVS
jgi:molybdopterin-guanine dinucleotide biosynthesis protein A